MEIIDNIVAKDFNQEDIHKFFTYLGRTIYSNQCFGSIPNGIKLNNQPKGKFKLTDISNLLKTISIIYPSNNRTYYGLDYILTAKSKEDFTKLDKTYDIKFRIRNGLILPQYGFPWYFILTYILPKYWTKYSTWNYKFYIMKEKSPYPFPVLTVPTNPKDWVQILSAFTEYAVYLKLFEGSYWKIAICDFSQEKADENNSILEKYFSAEGTKSIFGEVLSFLPSIVTLSYKLWGKKYVIGKLSKKLDESGREDLNPMIRQKLIEYGTKNFKDVYFVNLGNGSYFINPQLASPENIKSLEKYANVNRLRSEMDWYLKAYYEHKYLIFYCDNDNSVAIAHEMGHYLEEKDNVLGKIQRGNKNFIFKNKKFIKFVGFILGFAPALLTENITPQVIGEISGILSTILLRSPVLICEFMASYKGIEILKEIGCTKQELEKAKGFFKAAYGTYVVNSLDKGHYASLGKLSGIAVRNIKDRIMKNEQRNYSLSYDNDGRKKWTFKISDKTKKHLLETKDNLIDSGKYLGNSMIDSIKSFKPVKYEIE